ncbi:MAG: peptidyl-prolyl cis-trans isomerase [Clostridia bacterium]|nr:peptidyl-prolyl cis-trans isomerase [Clostridia bacterium]
MAKTKTAGKDNRTSPWIKLVLILAALLCVVTVLYMILSSTGFIARKATAMTVGKDTVSAMEMRAYYVTTRDNFLNQYGDVLSAYGYDTSSSSFESQPSLFDGSQTWKEYFLSSAEQTAYEISLLYQGARQSGYEMTEDDKAQVENNLAAYADAAEHYNEHYGTKLDAKRYIRALYGSGITMNDLHSYFEKRVVAGSYYKTLIDGFNISDADVNAYFNENTEEFTVVDYYRYTVNYQTYTYTEGSAEAGAPTSEAEAETMTQLAKASAKQTADAFLAALADDGSNFDALAAEYAEAADETVRETWLNEDVSLTSAATAGSGWAANESRRAGDKAVVEDEATSSYSVFYFLDRHINEDPTVAVRHILFKADSSADEDTLAAAKKSAEDVLAQWKSGAATEDSFAELAKEYSADSNADSGGLYTHIYRGQMVEEFQEWCFDESRKPGDTGIVKTDYGYHVMYFVENEGPRYLTTIRSKLESQSYNEWLDGQKTAFPVSFNKFGLSQV